MAFTNLLSPLTPARLAEAAEYDALHVTEEPGDMDMNAAEGAKADLLEFRKDDYNLLEPADILTETELSSGMFKYFNAKLTTLHKVQADVVTMLQGISTRLDALTPTTASTPHPRGRRAPAARVSVDSPVATQVQADVPAEPSVETASPF